MKLIYFALFLYKAGVVLANYEAKFNVSKCCAFNSLVVIDLKQRKQCVHANTTLDLSDSVVYDISGSTVRKSSFSFNELFDVVPSKFTSNKTFRRHSIEFAGFTQLNIYLDQTGELIYEIPNAYTRFNRISSNQFCGDYMVNDKNETKVHFWVYMEADEQKNETLLTVVMIITSVFLFLVLVVYLLLKELRNLCGLILMAYVTSLLAAFVLLVAIRLDSYEPSDCINLTCAIYFFFLAAFCWMNVMSYDIWWTFRGYAKARQIHRRGEIFKFMMYCLYAFGVPLAMTIFLRVIDSMDLSHIPWFIKPNIVRMGCFITDGQKLVYMYIPMLIMIMVNWLLFFMTAFNVWRLSRGTAVLDSAAAGTPAAHRTHMRRFLVYLKLSVVMGLNWLLEVVSFQVPQWRYLWWITDSYNLLIGVFIFIIFVCKPKIYRKLVKLVKNQKVRRWKVNQSSRSHTSSVDSSSQETNSVQICSNPKGPAYF